MSSSKDNSSRAKLVRGSTYFLMLLYAFSITMIGPLLPEIINDFKLQLAEGGLISTFQNMGGLLVNVLMIFIADRFKKSHLVIAGFTVYIISLFIMGTAEIYGILLAMFFILGVGTKTVDTLSNAFLSELYPESKTANLNLLHTFFGIGALLGPLYLRYMLDYGIHWKIIFRFLGAACILVLFLFITALKKSGREEEINSRYNNKGSFLFLLKNKKVWVLFLIMFLYTGHQSGINIWLPMYMEDYMAASPFLASISLSIFWAGIIFGRLIIARYGSILDNIKVIRWGSILGAVLMGTGILLAHPGVMIICAALTALLTGAFIPLVVDIASSEFHRSTGMITSIIFLALNMSHMLFPWTIGMIAQYFSFGSGMLLTSIALLGPFYLSFKFEAL